jgi:hypothetical protein
LSTGCQNKKPVAQVESSASLYSYAADYPAALNSRMTRYTEDANKSREMLGAFKGYPASLGDPDWATVAQIYEAADAEGRGAGFAERMAEVRIAAAFFEREKDDINRRVNSAVKNAVEKAECANCEVEAYGKVSYALKESVENSIEERLKESNQAFAVIAQNEKALGKKNVEALEEQAADIAFAAYVVFIEMPTIYAEVERRIDEAKTVEQTLDEEIAAEKSRKEGDKISKAEKKKIDEQIKEMENAKSAIKIFVDEAKRLVKAAETEIPAIRKEYEDAFDALMKEVKNRQKAAAPAAT